MESKEWSGEAMASTLGEMLSPGLKCPCLPSPSDEEGPVCADLIGHS